MKYHIFYGGSMWVTDAYTFDGRGHLVFDSVVKDGKFKITLREWDIISEQIDNISRPTLALPK